MRMLTFKAKPKVIFGSILALTGVIVILLTFVGNHNATKVKPTAAKIDCSTAEQRGEYLSQLGWQYDSKFIEKQVTVPKEFDDVYKAYNAIQKSQGFNLENYKGKKATVYTYSITNYGDDSIVVADLMVYDGSLIACDLCNPDAEEGFLVGLTQNEDAKA